MVGDRLTGPPDRMSHRKWRSTKQHPSRARAGAQFNSFVEISTEFSTDFSTKFPVLQGVPHYYKNSVEKSVEISTKLLN